jgi:hypothetical protein
MIRQVLVKPLVPGLVDGADRGEPGILACGSFDKGDHPQIDAREVRIGAKVIPYHHRSFGFELCQRAIDFLQSNSGAAESRRKFRHEPGL